MNEVFDTELELEDKNPAVIVRRLPSSDLQNVRFSDDAQDVVALVEEGTSGSLIRFERVTQSIRQRNVRVIIGSLRAARIIGVAEGVSYPIALPRDWKTVMQFELEVFGTRPEEIRPSPYLRYAIAAILFVGLTALIALWSRDTVEEPELSEVQVESTPIAEQLDPARFVPNTLLERFVDRTVRSERLGGILSPSNGDTVAVPFEITWKSEGGPLTIALVDNRNVTVWKKETGVQAAAVSDSLVPGLYYMKLHSEKDLLQVMRIFVMPED
jgi:hypothetical protein